MLNVLSIRKTRKISLIFIDQPVSVLHFLFPFAINLSSTLTIMIVVLKNKMNVHRTLNSTLLFHIPTTKRDPYNSFSLYLVTSNKIRSRVTVFQDVFNENREIITRPAITLIPSLFSLFSLPLFIISFSLGCQNLEDNPLGYLLIIFYFVTFIPQIGMFSLYIYPSSCYWKHWESTRISQWINARRQYHPFQDITSLFRRATKWKQEIFPRYRINVEMSLLKMAFHRFLQTLC